MKQADKCGIYQILCVPTGKLYIGSSKRIYARWYHHRISMRRGKSGCIVLQRAWTKYGEEAFRFSIIEECAFDDLEAREQFHINTLKPTLNLLHADRSSAEGISLKAALRTHCPHGHLYDEANTFIGKKGEKICRKCNADRVADIYDNETPEQREARRQLVKAAYDKRKQDPAFIAKQREITRANKEKKAEYDQRHRAERIARSHERRQNETPEQHAKRLAIKRRSYHRGKGHGNVDTSPHFSGEMLSAESRAKTSASLKEYNKRNPKPKNEPWIVQGISKTHWYRLLKRQGESKFNS